MYEFVERNSEIFEKNAAAVSDLLEGGRLPVLYSGLSEVHKIGRAHV